MDANNINFFYCYSKNLSDYLTSQNIKRVTIAKEPKTNKLFSLYIINDDLQQAIDKYKTITNK